MQKQTPSEARIKQITDTSIDKDVRTPRPDRMEVRPPLWIGVEPRLSRVMKL